MRFFFVAPVAVVPVLIALLVGVSPVRAQSGPAFNIMGPSTCAKWPRAAKPTSAAKAVPLNWVLGFLSGWAAQSDLNLLDQVDPEGVSAWMDAYCQFHPTENLPTAARQLERELEDRLPKPPPPPPPPQPPMWVKPPPAAEATTPEAPEKPKAKPKPRPRKPTAPRRPAVPATPAAPPRPAALPATPAGPPRPAAVVPARPVVPPRPAAAVPARPAIPLKPAVPARPAVQPNTP